MKKAPPPATSSSQSVSKSQMELGPVPRYASVYVREKKGYSEHQIE